MFLRAALPEILPGERTRLIRTVAGFMCVASAALLARTVGDTLFLSSYPASSLPYMFIATAIVVGGVSFVYGSAAARLPIERLIVIVSGILVALTLAVRIGLLFGWGGCRIAAYLLADLIANLPFLLVWSFAGLIFNPREARRLFGLIGAGGTVACILTGFLIKPYSAGLGVHNLLLLIALLLGGFAAIVAAMPEAERLRTRTPGLAGRPGAAITGPAYYSSLLKATQVRWLALLSIVATTALTLTDYLFKTTSRAHFQGEHLAAFFGAFYGSASAVALLIQLFAVHRVLQNWGLLLSLCVLPSALLLASVGAAVTSAFGWAVAARFAAQIFVFTIDSSAAQMLYQAVKKQTRNQARALVDGICRPASMAFVGLSISAASLLAAVVGPAAPGGGLPVFYPACACVLVCGVWFFAARGNYASYLSSLAESIGARRFDTDPEISGVHEKAFAARLRQLLATARDDEVPYLLEILPELGYTNLRGEIEGLLARESPSVRTSVLAFLKQFGGPGDVASILPQTGHSDSAVRIAAIRAVSSLDCRKAAQRVELCLNDPDPAVRAAAAVALSDVSSAASGAQISVEGMHSRRQAADHPGQDRDSDASAGIARLGRAEAVLQEMISSSDTASRVAAASALAQATQRDVTGELICLLGDSDSAVRQTALGACRGHADHRVIDALISFLADTEVAEDAADVLASFGQISTAPLLEFLRQRNPEVPGGAAASVPAILSQTGDSAALPVLLGLLGDPDLHLRREAIRACCSIARRQISIDAWLPDLESALARELGAAEEQLKMVDLAKPFVQADVLVGALHERCMGHLENAFFLLDLTIPEVDMNTLFLALTDGPEESHSSAVEILDNVVRSDIRPRLLEVLDRAGAEDRAGAGAGAGAEGAAEMDPSVVAGGCDERMRTILGADSSGWVRAGALYAIAGNGLVALQPEVEASLSNESPLIRETALHTLARVGTRDALTRWRPILARDPSPAVRGLVDSLVRKQEEVLIQA